MTNAAITPASLVPHLERCGYPLHVRLIPDYRFADGVVPFAGFYGRPFDTRSACVAVVEARGDTRSAAESCVALGAPTAFVCKGDSLEWWRLSVTEPMESRSVAVNEVAGFFDRHKAELAPEAIYSAKMRRPLIGRQRQLWFVDFGLMPAAERRAGETLHHLVEGTIEDLAGSLGSKLKSRTDFADLYKTVFWLLAAKLLHEKGVENFRRINLADVDEVFARVGRHYAETDDLPPGGAEWRPAIDAAAAAVATWGYLGNTSTESLAYLYETALVDSKPKNRRGIRTQSVDQNIRKELGIHSTPSMLIDHILSQLWPLVEQSHPPEDRHVFEPACGSAGFLVAAMRWLRDFSGAPSHASEDPHRFLRRHLHGVEVETFAAELARLSLTLADVPHGNHWDISTGDMFGPGVLEQEASRCALLLANPPYEPFTAAQRAEYTRIGSPPTAQTKAVEVLNRTIPHLKPGSAFGIVVPQGVLDDKESNRIRDFLLRECEVTEIDVFLDKLFNEGEHEVAVLMGRRRTAAPTSASVIYRRVRDAGMPAFKGRMAFSSERTVARERLVNSPERGLIIPELPEVWEYLAAAHGTLADAVSVEQGRQYWKRERLEELGMISDTPRPGWTEAVLRADDGYPIWGMPTRVWVDPSRHAYRRPGPTPGTPQVLLNYARAGREVWRLKAVVDEAGLGASSRFLVFRSSPGGPNLRTLWAILNSPVANAYAYSYAAKRETLKKDWRIFPFPIITGQMDTAIRNAAEQYLKLVVPTDGNFWEGGTRHRDQSAICDALTALDAEVLRAYDLPPRLERQLLDSFNDSRPRKGAGCDFRGYYPPELEAYIPLHELIADASGRSTLGGFLDSYQPVQSPRILEALRRAAVDFREE